MSPALATNLRYIYQYKVIRFQCCNSSVCAQQHHRGHPPASPIWVFGLVDTALTPALGVMQVVQQRDAATLLPIIAQHVRPGSEIWSDEWRAYNQVSVRLTTMIIKLLKMLNITIITIIIN